MPYRSRKETVRIILHDSHGVPSAAALLTQGRRMGVLTTGYHYMVERDGRVHRGRPHGAIGCHTPGHNHNSIGVCIIRRPDPAESNYTPEQLAGLRLLLGWLHEDFPGATLHGHSEVVRFRKGHKEGPCPANINMDDLRREVSMEGQTAEQRSEPLGVDGLSTQNRLIIEYLSKRGPLSNQTAIIELGIGSLTSRVAELRKRGYNIVGEDAEDFHGHRYKKYTLEVASAAK